MSRRARSSSRRIEGQDRQALRQQRLQDLQRFSRAAGSPRHRRRAHRHARSLARDHRDRSLPQRQGRLLPKAGNAHAARRSADDRRGAALRARVFRRQPARARRLSEPCRSGLGGRVRQNQIDQRQRRSAAPAVQSSARRNGREDRLGHVARPGPLGSRTTRSAAAAAFPSTGRAGVRSAIIRAAA